MGSLSRIWKKERLPLHTKLQVHMMCIVSVLLYGSESWTLLSSDSSCLEVFNIHCQKQILSVKCRIWFVTLPSQNNRSSERHCCHWRPSHCAVWPCRKIRRSYTNSNHAAPRHRRFLRHAPVSVLEVTSWPPSWLVAQTVPSLQHSHQGALGCCCWTWSWCFSATILAEHATLMIMEWTIMVRTLTNILTLVHKPTRHRKIIED